MQLDKVEASTQNTIIAEWRVWRDFYSGSYDWGLIFREIGERDKPANATNMFYKTRHTLENHVEEDGGQWAPANETLLASLEGLKSDTYYEVCLAAVEHSVIYYIHRKDCSEVRTPRDSSETLIPPTSASSSLSSSSSSQWLLPNARTSDLDFRASSNHGITVSWNVTRRQFWDGEPFSVVRKLSYRR